MINFRIYLFGEQVLNYIRANFIESKNVELCMSNCNSMNAMLKLICVYFK